MAVTEGDGASGGKKNLTMEQKLQILHDQHEANVRKLKKKFSGAQLEKNLRELNAQLKRDIEAVKRAFTKKPTTNPAGPTRGGDPRKGKAAEQAAKQEKPGGAPTRGGKPATAGPAPKSSKSSGKPRDEHAGRPHPANAPVYTGGPLNIKAILDYGMSLQGTPYVWGGESLAEGGFDCSGLVYAMFAMAGVKLPRVSGQQAAAGKAVSVRDARPGDLVAFDYSSRNSAGSKVDHIGIYLGNGKMLVAPKRGDVVKVQSVDLSTAVAIRRVVPEEAYTTLRQPDGTYKYVAGQQAKAQGKAGPTNSGPAAGGGDLSNSVGPNGEQPITLSSTTSGQPVTTSDIASGNAPLPGEPTTAEDYGFAAALFNSDPELQRLLKRALTGDGTGRPWTAERFAVEFKKSKWYTSRTESEIAFAIENTAQPANMRRKIDVRADEVRRAAAAAGVTLSEAEIRGIATSSIKYGYTPQETQMRILTMGQYGTDPDAMSGEAGQNADTIRALAAAYGLTLTDAQIVKWVRDLALKEKNDQDLDNWIKEQAKILYPALSKQIDAGLTPQDVAGLYTQSLASILELDPNSIDWAQDPLIKRAMSYQDPESKEVGAMPLWLFEQEAKKDPRWAQTDNAHNSLMGVGAQVLRDWGLVF